MKKIITTVGTSLFTNLVSLNSNYKNLLNKPHEDWNSETSRISDLRKTVLSNIQGFESSAELQSLSKILSIVKDDVEIYFLATDTILSRLACEILQEKQELLKKINQKISISFNPKLDVISELQVGDSKKFKEGLVNLLYRVEDIARGYWENTIFNITGGFKATIAFLTILAQVRSVVSYYTFEDSTELLKIPNLPISINTELFEKYWENFEKLESENTLEKDQFKSEFLHEAESCLELVKNLVSLNPLGLVLWRKYKEKFFIYYSPDNVEEALSKQKNIQSIIKEKFANEQTRKSKTENKNNHLVYDDGRNQNRIFYFEENKKLYIYKTFQSHDDYDRYLNITPKPNEQEIINNSKLRKLER